MDELMRAIEYQKPKTAAPGTGAALCCLRRFVRCDAGATAIEYGLLAGLVTLAAVSGFQLLSASLGDMFNYISSNVVQSISGG